MLATMNVTTDDSKPGAAAGPGSQEELGRKMSDESLWNQINDVRDRLARYEERSNNRDARISEMTQEMDHISEKLDRLLSLVAQAEGAKKTAMLFGKWGWGISGVIGATIVANWQGVKKLFF